MKNNNILCFLQLAKSLKYFLQKIDTVNIYFYLTTSKNLHHISIWTSTGIIFVSFSIELWTRQMYWFQVWNHLRSYGFTILYFSIKLHQMRYHVSLDTHHYVINHMTRTERYHTVLVLKFYLPTEERKYVTDTVSNCNIVHSSLLKFIEIFFDRIR